MRVYESLVDVPKMSLRRRAAALALSFSSFQRIMKKDLALYPYHINKLHAMRTSDLSAVWFAAKVQTDDDFLDHLW